VGEKKKGGGADAAPSGAHRDSLPGTVRRSPSTRAGGKEKGRIGPRWGSVLIKIRNSKREKKTRKKTGGLRHACETPLG